jgi:hypothetical protein
VVIIINYVCSISCEVFYFLNFLHMICASSQIKLKYKFNTVISWQYYIICVKCYMKHFVKGGNHVSNDIRIWWALHVFVKYYDPRLSLHFWKWNKMHPIIFLHVFYFFLKIFPERVTPLWSPKKCHFFPLLRVIKVPKKNSI